MFLELWCSLRAISTACWATWALKRVTLSRMGVRADPPCRFIVTLILRTGHLAAMAAVLIRRAKQCFHVRGGESMLVDEDGV